MTGPGIFSDIGKRAKDVLTKGYTRDHKVSVSTVTASGLGLTSSAVNKRGLHSCGCGISSEYKHKNTLINVTADTESRISTTLTVLKALPSTNLVISVKPPDYNAGKVELQYSHFHDNASFAAVVGIKPSLVIECSGAVGAQGIAFAAEGKYDTAKGKFTKYNAGIGITKQYYQAGLILANKGNIVELSGLYQFDEKQKASVVTEYTRKILTSKNTYTVGGLYTFDSDTMVKVKLNSSGRVAALFQHMIKPKSTLTISSEFDTKALDRTPKLGLAFCYKHRADGSNHGSNRRRHGPHHPPEPVLLVVRYLE